ncbi:J domain-containing protein [Arenimonas caeni]|uniref:J domain-containing protein n=1 Tax=Arenimonas caeni TaxID=2058085 RepID=A0A2P6MBN5_9GAMM|nr:J domain-containing protein [Arenimonas caeni]PRH83414.1 hypothetical protein C6N40_01835 [Arenimonas caeni]
MGQALEQALAFWRAPALLAAARQRPLPADVLEVVRIAAGDRAAAEFAAAALGASVDDIAEAAPFYLQQLLFAPGADSYRVLGVNPDAPDARIKDHYRWLVRWLHPDRNADEWEALYADRVNRAWQDLRQPDKRAAYDAVLAGAGDEWADTGRVGPEAPTTRPVRPAGGPSGPALHQSPVLSARTTRRLPILVLGSFGLLAGAALALMWYAQTPRSPRVPQSPPPVAAAPAPEPRSAPESAVALAVAAEPAPAVEPDAVPESGLEGRPERALERVPVLDTTPAAIPATSLATAPVGGPSGPTATRQPQPVSRPNPQPQPASLPPAAPVVAAVAPAPAAVAPEGAPTGETAPADAARPAPIAEADALALLDAFTRTYAAGDLRGLMRLFTRDASNNRGGRDAIAYDYQQLFDQSETRELQLRPNGWLQGEASATVLARFEARVKYPGDWRASRSNGEIRFDLAREDGVLRIRSLRHDER